MHTQGERRVEIRVMLSQAKEFQELGKGPESDPSSTPSKGVPPRWHFDLELLASRMMN
jgi:hypothetical protein